MLWWCFFFLLTMSFIYCRLLLETPVPVTSSLSRGSAVVCALLALEWRYHVARRIPSVHLAKQVRRIFSLLSKEAEFRCHYHS